MRHRADVILVAVRQDQRLNPVLLQLAQVRNDQVDPEQLRFGEHHPRVDKDRRVAAGDDQHVHAELAQAAERNQLERGRWRRTGIRSVSQTESPSVEKPSVV